MRISRVAPLLAPLWDLGPLPARRAGAAAPQPWVEAPQRRALLVEGWGDEAEGSGGHWVGITHDGSVRCLLRGVRPLAPPKDARAAAAEVLASTPRVYAVWYAVLPAPGAPQQPPQHPRSGVARDPRARGGVAAAPRGAGRVRNALTQVCGHWAALPVRPPKPSLPPPPATSQPRPLLAPPPPRPGERGNEAGGDTDPPPRRRVSAPPPRPPPSRPPTLPPHPPPRPTRGTAVSLPPPPPARGGGWGRAACMAGRYAESSGQPSSAPRAACEPQDRPSNQIKSNPYPPPLPPPPYLPPLPSARFTRRRGEPPHPP